MPRKVYLMMGKSVTQLLEEVAMTKNCLSPDVLWENVSRLGIKESVWMETTDIERGLFKQFVGNKINESKNEHVEYAYYFWSRILKRLVEGKTPIGMEWVDNA